MSVLNDYQCPNCPHTETDKLVRSLHTPVQCPMCGEMMQRTITAPSLAFKGDSWACKGGYC